MKNLFCSIALLTSVLAVSCKKGNEAKPQNAAAAPTTLNIEYHISGASSDIAADYLVPNANGKLENVHEIINRSSKVISFTYSTGHLFSVSASNETPSHDVIQVEIYVNGTLVAQSSSTDPSQKAIAQGNF